MMLRTLSWMTVVGPVPRGPIAELTASAPPAYLGRGAVEHPREELGGTPQAVAPPGRLAELGPAIGAKVFLHERQGFVFLVLHVSPQRAGQRLDIVRNGRRVAGSNAGVDPGEQRVDGEV